MTGQQARIARQRKYLFLDALHQRIPIPAGEICTADRTREDQIAAETNTSRAPEMHRDCSERKAERFMRSLSTKRVLSGVSHI